jgi:flagellar motility protein MotE (MotC chaperone)
MNQCTIDTPTSEKVLLYEKSAPNVPLRDEKSQQEERPDAQNTDEVERLKIENGVLLKQHKEDQEEKKYMTERIKSLEEQIHKLTTERDEQRQKLIDLQDGAHGTKEANNDLCYSSQDELNNDLNYDTPEE